jgi:hypothetical protein
MMQYRADYCETEDMSEALEPLCNVTSDDRINRDVDYTRLIDDSVTLELDFTDENDATHDESDVFALAANLYGNVVQQAIPEASLRDPVSGRMNTDALYAYMDMRALIAKRSVAHNSYAAIAAMKSQGGEEVRPYLEAILREMGIQDDEITRMLGTRPSYYAQMEILTKKIYQNPSFYANLYDKPVNVDRQIAAMKAIDMIQKRDIYRSLLRSEAITSVMLESSVSSRQSELTAQVDLFSQDGNLATAD